MFTGEFGGILGEFGGIFLEHSDVEVCHSFAVALPSILIFNSGAFLINFNLGGVFLIKSHIINISPIIDYNYINYITLAYYL